MNDVEQKQETVDSMKINYKLEVNNCKFMNHFHERLSHIYLWLFLAKIQEVELQKQDVDCSKQTSDQDKIRFVKTEYFKPINVLEKENFEGKTGSK